MTQQANVLLASPAYRAEGSTHYFQSVLQLLGQRYDDMTFSWMFIDDSHVTRARNHLAATFLQHTQFTHLLMVDVDTGFEPDMLARLVRSDRDVAAGICPAKRLFMSEPKDINPEWTRAQMLQSMTKYVFTAAPDAEIEPDGFCRVVNAGSGVMCIKRSTFEKIAEGVEGIRFKSTHDDYQHLGYIHNFFGDMIDPATEEWLSEDYAFCRRAQMVGCGVYVDANSRYIHYGVTGFVGDFPLHHSVHQETLARATTP